ncbi:TonB-linked outer membrane protein, SusC/RagA family [compost metagenome]
MRFFYLSLCCFLLLASPKAFAQEAGKPTFSVDFSQATLGTVVNDLEKKSGLHFYYPPQLADSLSISAKIEQKTLSVILSQLFENSSIRYAVYQNEVFLTQDKELRTDLAPGYYPNDISVKSSDSSDAEIDEEDVISATAQNKRYEIGLKTNVIKKGTATIAGYIRDIKTGEPVASASIFTPDRKAGTISDKNGFYSITIPTGPHVLTIQASGNRETTRQLVLYSDGKLNIEMKEQVVTLKEVNIISDKPSNVKSLEMGVNRLDIKAIKQIPSAFGEADVLKVVLTLPGVQSVGEASSGFNVRGGSADQNLILLNDATIYNPAHFFGFFSAFNPDIVKDVQLYKSTIPEKFGGRLSSVLEVTNRDGNKSKFSGSAGIGLVTSRLNIEGPIDSGRTSFIFGGRTTYSNWLLKLLPKGYKESKAAFSDLNLGISHKINDRNELTLSTYYSQDDFKLNSDTNYSYNNKNASIKWRHLFNDKLKSDFTIGTDSYEYNVKSDVNPVNAYHLKFKINQSNFKSDFTYTFSKSHSLNFGLSSILYNLQPGSYKPIGSESLVQDDVVATERALESALYIGDKLDISNNFSVSAGLRYSIYNYLGPQSINRYAPNLPKTEANLLGTDVYGKNKFINTYHGPEVRMSARYNFSADFSVKAAYNTLRQYIHLLSNTTAIAPTDVWKLSDPNVKPQFGDQVSLGLYKNFKSQTIETSVEVYYKNLKDYLDYKSGANIVLNHHIETDVVNTKGKAYGVEFFVKKNTGKINGWISYAYSRTLLKMDDPTNGALINGGRFYPANYDKPHAVNFAGNYRFKQRYHLSVNVSYSTGRPITVPIAKYYYAGSERVYYSDRNAFRIPDYFRTDVSFNVEGNHKLNQLFHNSWTFGVYNLTGRKNAYSTYFTQENGSINGYKLSIFASAIPFINYNIRF